MICIAMLGHKSIILHLARKGINLAAIYQNLCTTVSLDPVSYPMLTRILQEKLSAHGQWLAQELAVEPDPSVIDLTIA
jgi:hypothetical protein